MLNFVQYTVTHINQLLTLYVITEFTNVLIIKAYFILKSCQNLIEIIHFIAGALHKLKLTQCNGHLVRIDDMTMMTTAPETTDPGH